MANILIGVAGERNVGKSDTEAELTKWHSNFDMKNADCNGSISPLVLHWLSSIVSRIAGKDEIIGDESQLPFVLL